MLYHRNQLELAVKVLRKSKICISPVVPVTGPEVKKLFIISYKSYESEKDRETSLFVFIALR